jgi:hypothetical protein
MLFNTATSAIWMAFLVSAAGMAYTENITRIDGPRIFNPPSEGMSVFKLRQWTQKPQDKPWCITGNQVINVGETQQKLLEEECSLTSDRQLINKWEVNPGSLAYMIRFTDSDLCMTVEDGRYTQHARRSINGPGHKLDLSDFRAPLVHRGRVKTNINIQRRASFNSLFSSLGIKRGSSIALPNQTDTMAPVTPGVPKPVAPVADPSKGASLNGTAVNVQGRAVPVILSQCVGNDNQIFKARIVARPGLPSNYYQLMSYKYKTCLASERKNLAEVVIVPCADNDESQLWLFEDINQTIKDIGSRNTAIQYANTLQIPDFEVRLGLSRNTSVSGLTYDEQDRIERLLPGSSKEFNMIFELARLVNTYVRNVLQYQQSGTVLVSKMVGIFLTPEQRPAAWEKVWDIGKMLIELIPVPARFKSIKSAGVELTDKILKQLSEYQKKKPPTPRDLIQWDVYALHQAEYTVDALFDAFTEVFRQSSIDDLRSLLQEFKAGKYIVSADDFYRQYQIRFSQKILSARAGDFWTSVCVSRGGNVGCDARWNGKSYRENDRTYQDYYSTNINKDGINYIDGLGELDNFYKANNGWSLERYYYTCPNNNRGQVCVAKIVLRQNASNFEVI